MALLTILRELKSMEEGLSIADPVTIGSPLAYLTVPDKNAPLARAQAVFEHFPEAGSDEDRMGDFREDVETVRVRFTAYDADFDRGVEIAVAFWDAFHDAIDGQRGYQERLNGAFDHVMVRGGEGGVFQSFDGRPGWEVTLDFRVFKDVSA